MKNIRETFLKKYGIAEYFLFVIGAVLLGVQVYRYASDTLEGAVLEITVTAVASLFILAPMTLVNIIRKAKGLEPK
jgi:hypothetical protein